MTTTKKERAQSPCEAAPESITRADSTATERPLYLHLQVPDAGAWECRPTKITRILDALCQPHGLNRFEAERLGDHVLNSTVAALRREGWSIHGEWEIVPTRYSPKGVRVMRYRCVGRGAQ